MLTFSIWTIAAASTPVWSQDEKKAPRRAIFYSASYTPIYQFETDMDHGGGFEIQRHQLQLGFIRSWSPQFRMGLGFSYHLEKWDFEGRSPGLGIHPWHTVHRFGIHVPTIYAGKSDWVLNITPSIEFAGESGAEMGESLSYGGVISVSHAFDPTLSLGLGFGFFMQPEETTVFPFIAIDWRIHPQLRLTHPFQSGPAGPAGLEWVYTPSQDWELGLGVAYRTHRFRLDEGNSVANGIGENEALVSFSRVQRKLTKGVQLDLVGGMVLDGKLTLDNSNGDTIGSEGYDSVPFIALTFAGQF